MYQTLKRPRFKLADRVRIDTVAGIVTYATPVLMNDGKDYLLDIDGDLFWATEEQLVQRRNTNKAGKVA